MLRVGLTGELGSGKSTVAAMFAEMGAVVFSSDEMGRRLMQPGEAVYAAIVEQFGPGVVRADALLDRKELARLAFDKERQRVAELNAIVHPAVLQEQARVLAALAEERPRAIAVVESALIFTVVHGVEGRSWRERFDAVVLVTAPDAVKVERFVARVHGDEVSAEEREAALADAWARLSVQRVSAEDAAGCMLLPNDGGVEALRARAEAVWRELQRMEGEKFMAGT